MKSKLFALGMLLGVLMLSSMSVSVKAEASTATAPSATVYCIDGGEGHWWECSSQSISEVLIIFDGHCIGDHSGKVARITDGPCEINGMYWWEFSCVPPMEEPSR